MAWSSNQNKSSPLFQVFDRLTATELARPAAWQQINTNQFLSLLGNNKLRRHSEKYGFQTSLICHNTREEKLNKIIRSRVPNSGLLADNRDRKAG